MEEWKILIISRGDILFRHCLLVQLILEASFDDILPKSPQISFSVDEREGSVKTSLSH
jgi:hypothetical protein